MTTPGGLAQVVQFAASTFTVNSGKLLCWSKGITVRGAGRGQTTMRRPTAHRHTRSSASARTLAAGHHGPVGIRSQ